MNRAAAVEVTGMGCVSAAGLTLKENLATLDAGHRAPAPPVLFPAEKHFPVFMCPLPEPQLADVFADDLPPAATRGLSRTVHLALRAVQEALSAAELTVAELAPLRVGVCLGTSVGTALEFYEYYEHYRQGQQDPSDVIHTYLNSNPALAVARLLHLRGPVQTITNACSSGADAIGTAAGWIRRGLCDVVICGGCDALSRVIYYGFSSLQLLSPQPCLPFDAQRTGLNLGEGAGIMVLESPARCAAKCADRCAAKCADRGAEKRADQCAEKRAEKGADEHTGWHSVGRIRGYGTATDAHHLTAPHPEARGLKKALAQALAQADATTEHIAFINAHGTATKTNDTVESYFFRTILPQVPFVATKGCTGHTLGAAGAIEAIFALAHLQRHSIPASPGFGAAEPEAGVCPVSTPTAVHKELALSQSLAFGGNNSILLLDCGDRP